MIKRANKPQRNPNHRPIMLSNDPPRKASLRSFQGELLGRLYSACTDPITRSSLSFAPTLQLGAKGYWISVLQFIAENSCSSTLCVGGYSEIIFFHFPFVIDMRFFAFGSLFWRQILILGHFSVVFHMESWFVCLFVYFFFPPFDPAFLLVLKPSSFVFNLFSNCCLVLFELDV